MGFFNKDEDHGKERIGVLEARFDAFQSEITKQWTQQAEENKALRTSIKEELHTLVEHIDKAFEVRNEANDKTYVGAMQHQSDMNKLGRYTREELTKSEERVIKKLLFQGRMVVAAFVAGFGIFIYVYDIMKT